MRGVIDEHAFALSYAHLEKHGNKTYPRVEGDLLTEMQALNRRLTGDKNVRREKAYDDSEEEGVTHTHTHMHTLRDTSRALHRATLNRSNVCYVTIEVHIIASFQDNYVLFQDNYIL